MSTRDRIGRRDGDDPVSVLDAKLDAVGRRAFHVVFGDRVGAAVFVAALLFFSLFWRVEFLSTDNYMHVNVLLSASDGGLAIDRFAYGPPTGETPGVHYLDGRVYGDNYGLILTSLPAFFVYGVLSTFVELSLALAGLWSLGVLALVVLVRPELDYDQFRVTLVGAGVAFVAFLVNAAVVEPLSPRWVPLLALQTTSMVAAAFVAVTLYRLATTQYERRVGTAAGVATFLATPVAFWAVVPKRHSATALFAIVALYAFYRSRSAATEPEETKFRALAYAAVGLCTWVHSAEALILFVALVPVDLATARTNRPRHLAVVAAAFAVSLLPFLLTNYAVTGNPAQPLRLVPKYTGQPLTVDHLIGNHPTGDSTAGGATPTGTETIATTSPKSSSEAAVEASRTDATGTDARPDTPAPTPSLAERVSAVIAGLAAVARRGTETAVDGVGYFTRRLALSARVLGDVERFADVFFRSGYRPTLRASQDRAVNLSVLESMPLLGVGLALPILAIRTGWVGWRNRVLARSRPRRNSRRTLPTRPLSPARATDLFVATYAVLLVVFYVRVLPLHHMLTVRYLHPLYPLGVYVLVRTPAVRRVLEREWAVLRRSYVVGVALSLPLYLGALVAFDAVHGEAVQLYGLCAFAVGLCAGVWTVRAELGRSDRTLRGGALVLGLAAAVMTVYLLVSGVVLFSVTGEFALPVSGAVSDALAGAGVDPFR